jgi:Putative auto-transporter adhesin, head GIN domain
MKSQRLLLVILAITTAGLVQAQKRENRNLRDFTKVSFGFPGKCYVTQGKEFKVELEGDPDVLEKVKTKVEDGRLTISNLEKWNWSWGSDDRIVAYVTLPQIEGLSVSGSGDLITESTITSSGLDLRVSGSGNMDAKINVNGDLNADVSGSGDLEVTGTCQGFHSDVSGSGNVKSTVMINGNASFGVSGSGNIRAAGSAPEVKISISGSGKVMASDLEATRCNVRISGSGDVEIGVKEDLDVRISGSGSVRYRGNPDKVNSHAAGSGSVRKL